MKNYDSIVNNEDVPTKKYVDDAEARSVAKAGDTMTNRLNIVPANNSNPLALKGGTADGCYISLFPKAADQASRGAFVGFGNTGQPTFTISNEYADGNIRFLTNGGELIAQADPVSALGVATKQYVDGGGISYKFTYGSNPASVAWYDLTSPVVYGASWGKSLGSIVSNKFRVTTAGVYRFTAQFNVRITGDSHPVVSTGLIRLTANTDIWPRFLSYKSNPPLWSAHVYAGGSSCDVSWIGTGAWQTLLGVDCYLTIEWVAP